MIKHSLRIIALLCAVIGPLEAFEPTEDGIYAVFTTSLGEFTAKLFYEEAPITVAHFIRLAEGTLPRLEVSTEPEDALYDNFYNGMYFLHGSSGKIIEEPYFDGLIIDTIAPTYAFKFGFDMGYRMPNEYVPEFIHDRRGLLTTGSLSNWTEPSVDANGSEFFVTLGELPEANGLGSIFGEVVEGMVVIDVIESKGVLIDDNVVSLFPHMTTEPSTEGIIITSVEIVRFGGAAISWNELSLYSPKVSEDDFDETAIHIPESILGKISDNELTQSCVDSEYSRFNGILSEPLFVFRVGNAFESAKRFFYSTDMAEWLDLESYGYQSIDGGPYYQRLSKFFSSYDGTSIYGGIPLHRNEPIYLKVIETLKYPKYDLTGKTLKVSFEGVDDFFEAPFLAYEVTFCSASEIPEPYTYESAYRFLADYKRTDPRDQSNYTGSLKYSAYELPNATNVFLDFYRSNSRGLIVTDDNTYDPVMDQEAFLYFNEGSTSTGTVVVRYYNRGPFAFPEDHPSLLTGRFVLEETQGNRNGQTPLSK
jgi:cyclophilin family peptidyl-prolyl cis-trans isomerase